MRCRSLYKNGNYNLTWFCSQGLKFPKYLIFNFNRKSDNIEIKKVVYVGTDAKFPIRYLNEELGVCTLSKLIITKGDKLNNSQIEISAESSSEDFELIIYLENDYGKKIKVFPYTKEEQLSKKYDLVVPFKKWACAIKVNDNYADKEEGTSYDLIQRLSIIKGELWYQINYGLPIFDKIRNKAVFDSVIINIINKHPDVRNILSFESEVVNHNYSFKVKIDTIFNEAIEFGTEIG